MLERIIAVQATESRGADTGIDLRAGDQVNDYRNRKILLRQTHRRGFAKRRPSKRCLGFFLPVLFPTAGTGA